MMKSRGIQTNWQTHFFLATFALLFLSDLATEAAKMYWTSEKGIQRADLGNLGSKNFETFLPIELSSPVRPIHPRSLTVDVVGKKLYWVDQGKIQRASLNATDIEDLIKTEPPTPSPGRIALDVDGGKIYWTAGRRIGKVFGGSIHRANLDGTNVEVVIMLQDLELPNGLALDAFEGKLYWAMNDKIYRANLDGTNVEKVIVGLTFPANLTLDGAAGKLYWTSRGKIQRANKDGALVEDLVAGLKDPWRLILDKDRGKIYWTDVSTYKIQRANLDGTNIEDLMSGLEGPGSLALDSVSGKIYWTDILQRYTSGAKIQRANLDGTGVETLSSPKLIFPEGIVVDPVRGKVYWTNRVISGKIQRANLDGTEVEDLVTGLSYPKNIALDAIEGKIYWAAFSQAQPGVSIIQRANLDGSNFEELPINAVQFIAIHARERKLYWTSPQAGKIQRSNLDGTDIEDIVIGLKYPQGIAIDAAAGKIYWTHVAPANIQRANLDGTNVEVLIPGLRGPKGIAVDPNEGKLYWTQSWVDWEINHFPTKGLIQRANLDGTSLENLFTEFAEPRFIALDLPPASDGLSVNPRGKQAVLWGRLRQNALLQNFPNPFNPETWIPYQLSEDTEVTIRIYDVIGRPVRTLNLSRKEAGIYISKDQAAYWDGRNNAGELAASGVYYYRMEAGSFAAIRKMIIAK